MTRSSVLRCVSICGLCSALSGCFLNALFSRVTVNGFEEEANFTLAAIQASASVALCSDLGGAFGNSPVACTYVVDGQEIASTFSLASEFGLLGAIIDPVILQVPIAATNFTGTYSGTSSSGTLDITVVAGALDADVNERITPEPGTKLVVVDFPASASPPGGAYGFNFGFQLPGVVNPVQVKALFAARVQSGGRTFYPPLFPCTTNFATVPSISMPLSAAFQAVNLAGASGLSGCSGRTYRLSTASTATTNEIPALHPALLGLLAVLIAWAGARLTGRA
jgi:hypothetical protein